MQTVRIDDLGDPRLDAYRDLRGNNRTRDLGLFLAEGVTVVRALIQSDFAIQSILVSDKKFGPLSPAMPSDVPIYRVTQSLAQQLVGYSFHAGALACGYRQPLRPLESIVRGEGSRLAILIAPQVVDPENVGALIRTGAAFGVDAVVFGPNSPDPFSRRALRVSLANGLFVPIVESADLLADLQRLRANHGIELIAAVVEPNAVGLRAGPRPERFALLVGHETAGLDPKWTALCDHRMTIEMHHDRVSLNVATAAGIFLYGLVREQSAGRRGDP